MKRILLSYAGCDAGRIGPLLKSLEHPDLEIETCRADAAPQDLRGDAAQAFRQELGRKVARTGITVCLIGEETHKDPWVAAHLEKSFQKGSRIIFMALPGVREARLPEFPQARRLVFYPWDPARLIRLIIEEQGKLFNNAP